MERFWSKVQRAGDDECWYWRAGIVKGYGQFWIAGKNHYAHRVSYLLTHGWMPETVRHSCDNPPCCNPAHLIAGTQADNMRDKHDRGRAYPMSEVRKHRSPEVANGSNLRVYSRQARRLTDDEVREVRALVSTRAESLRSIASRLHVSYECVRLVAARRTYTDVM